MSAAARPASRAPLPGAGALRASLVFVWLATGAVSALDVGGRSHALLAEAGLHDPTLAALALWGGAAGDLGLGVLLWARPGRAACALALAWTLLMTLAATLVVPGRWFDPLGPLTKNLPIVVALVVLGREPCAPREPREPRESARMTS